MNLAGWARLIVGRLPDHVRRDVADDPAIAIELHFPLSITAAESFEQRGANGWCDGMSISDGGIILYRPTHSRRQNFTLCHELAHHLVVGDDQCLAWLADQPEPRRQLEQLCDQVAAQLLIARDDIDSALAGGAPDAAAVARLYRATSASRSACAIAVAQRLPCDGFVTLVEQGDDRVFFAARARDTRPYAWRGDPVPAGHPLRQDQPPERTLAWWPYPGVTERREYFMSSAVEDGWVSAVLAENNLWGVPGFHLPRPVEDDRGHDGTIDCPCGYRGSTRWWPCANCRWSRCPRCQECECDRRARRERFAQCASCTLSVRDHLLDDNGLCPACQ